VGKPSRPLSPRHLAAAKEFDRQYEEALRVFAQEFLRAAGSPQRARRLLSKAIEVAEDRRKRPRGRPQGLNFFALQLAAEIQRQNPRFKRRKALLAAGVLKGELRRYEDKLRGRTLAEYVESCPIKVEFTSEQLRG
jgi:hypothetical protein